jgi:hypothetical protein
VSGSTSVAALASTGSVALFLLLVLAVAILFVKAAARATASADPRRSRVGAAFAIALVFLGWLVVPGLLAARGMLDRWSPMPAPPFVVIGLLTLATLALALSPFGARVAERFSLAALVGYQFFRVPLEWLLHRLAHEGLVPAKMTFAGSNWDIASGVLAVLVAMYWLGGGRARAVVAVWNVVGLLLLLNVVTLAVRLTPAFGGEPANLLPALFPWVWLPTFLVQAALFGHVVVFRALARPGAEPARAAEPAPA